MVSNQPAASARLVDGRLHRRRCAARDSMTLPRKRQKLHHRSDDSGSLSCVASAPGPSPHCSLRKKNSQESDGDVSASKWFDTANSNTGSGLQRQSGYDNEPPFFISQSHPPGCVDPVEHGVSDSKPFGGYSQQDSEKEDLRDVIDDLTIENKRLKQLLKNRKSHKDFQDRDKLFEVRVHGLSSDKKRALEELLRSFAASLNIHAGPPGGLLSGPPPGAPKPNHGGTTHLGQTDSGYASNSNSGLTSATPSNPGRPSTSVSRKSNDKTIKSYLHNIPNGLLPKPPLVLSERAKMSLVVRRLENLFTGKKAAPGEHSQPLQQQEVSRLAANAEMQQTTRHHRQEGSREAHILPATSHVNIERLESSEGSSTDGKSGLTTKSDGSGTSTPEGGNSTSSAGRSPDQRPTRPLDLDVHRAQVAKDNIEYIRHLGLTSPKLHAEADNEDGEGWIYLNLLISMAQLHTINVAPAFIRKSIKKLSAKFELSEDGNKVRWKGGVEATQFPAGTVQDPDLVDGTAANDILGLGRTTTDKLSEGRVASTLQTSATPSEDRSSNPLTSHSSMRVQPFSINPEHTTSTSISRSQPASSFDYKPILLTGKAVSRPNGADMDEASVWQWRLDNSSVADSNDTSEGGAEYGDAGPIVFYHSTLFCSDFSGDRAPMNMKRPTWETSRCALGVSATAQFDETRDRDTSYFAKDNVGPISEPELDAFTLDVPPTVDSCHAEQPPRDLPASGIGGVTPQDNFIIDVEIARTPCKERGGGGDKTGRGVREPQHFRYHVATCLQTDLPPSQLPPPSYIFLPFTSSSSSAVGEACGSEDDAVDTSIDEHGLVLPVFLAQFQTEDSSPNDGDEEMDTESSVDMHHCVRAANRARAAPRDRAFESARRHAFLDNSLAATAGDGSDIDSGVESDVDEGGSGTDSEDDW